jgi:ribosomal protein S20
MTQDILRLLPPVARNQVIRRTARIARIPAARIVQNQAVRRQVRTVCRRIVNLLNQDQAIQAQTAAAATAATQLQSKRVPRGIQEFVFL